MRAAAILLLLAVPAGAAPQRIVSVNLCADQHVVLLADRAQIAALSPLAADTALSAVADRATGIRRTRVDAESVLALNPGLVVAGGWGGRGLAPLLRARGIALLRLDLAHDFDAIRAQLVAVGEAVGQPARAAAAIAAMDAALGAIDARPRPAALVWQAAGFTPGRGTLADAVLHAAGRRNAAPFAGYGSVRLEALVAAPPGLLVLPARTQGAGASLSEALLAHPALAAIPTARIEPAWLACGSVATVAAVAALAR